MHRFVPQIAGYRLNRTIGAAPVENNCDFNKARGTGLTIFAGPNAKRPARGRPFHILDQT
jgi:hypothetical protein